MSHKAYVILLNKYYCASFIRNINEIHATLKERDLNILQYRDIVEKLYNDIYLIIYSIYFFRINVTNESLFFYDA